MCFYFVLAPSSVLQCLFCTHLHACGCLQHCAAQLHYCSMTALLTLQVNLNATRWAASRPVLKGPQMKLLWYQWGFFVVGKRLGSSRQSRKSSMVFHTGQQLCWPVLGQNGRCSTLKWCGSEHMAQKKCRQFTYWNHSAYNVKLLELNKHHRETDLSGPDCCMEGAEVHLWYHCTLYVSVCVHLYIYYYIVCLVLLTAVVLIKWHLSCTCHMCIVWIITWPLSCTCHLVC